MPMLDIFERILRDGLRGATNPYTFMRTTFARLDQEVAFAIDGFRKNRLKNMRISELESRLQERLAAFEELGLTVDGAQTAEFERAKEELRWVLQQIQDRRSL